MTQPLRTLHRRAMIALAILLPAIFIAGLAARAPAVGENPQIRWEALPGKLP
jgi:hypothetical protein